MSFDSEVQIIHGNSFTGNTEDRFLDPRVLRLTLQWPTEFRHRNLTLIKHNSAQRPTAFENVPLAMDTFLNQIVLMTGVLVDKPNETLCRAMLLQVSRLRLPFSSLI